MLTTLFNLDVEPDEARLRVVSLRASDAPLLQDFFDRNPEYFHICNGRVPLNNEALQEIQDEPPAEVGYARKWVLAVLDTENRVMAMTIVFSDFLAEGVWLISLYMVDKTMHGNGFALRFYQQLESWMISQNAKWIRLGIVKGNIKAEKFWLKCGYVQIREREGVPSGLRVNTLRVMVKPLCSEGLEQYLLKVTRDRPEQ